MISCATVLLLGTFNMGADLELLRDGRTPYQIVVPDATASTAIDDGLAQTARLVQSAFVARGATIPIVAESRRDGERPAVFLGNTRRARDLGIHVEQLAHWSYVIKVDARDVIVVGHDHPGVGGAGNDRRPAWDRIGTAKAAVDFLREYAGVRFLYPDLPPYTPVSGAARVDLILSPAIEYLAWPAIVVPDTLDVRRTPPLRYNTSHPAGGGFYDLAHHRFPRVSEAFGGHTWERAIPPAQYFDQHPEYFALINGARLRPVHGNAQYCISNPEVQELIYRDLASLFDRGFQAVDLGQPDGFQPCQCPDCDKLLGTGSDWSEKIWLFHRRVAERLNESHPGRQVTIMSYIQTAAPPKTFQNFPANTAIMLTGTNEDDIAPWRACDVPRGFTGYIYNWCPNLGSRYTPMRTPQFVEAQVKRLTANRIQSLYRDGPGQLFGLEGPVYYVMGRMFDDPGKNSARELVTEFCDAAFGRSAPPMRSFYDQLYSAIMLYSDHLGTRCDLWTYQPLEGRPRKTVSDPFQLIAFLYPPRLLSALESDLRQAEQLANTPKVKARLAIVRTEFEYLTHLARAVHLYHAYQIQPDDAARTRLLDAIDRRNAWIESLYAPQRQPTAPGDWSHVFFPFAGHDAKHLRLAYDLYQEPFAHTCLNWDTSVLRNAPAPGKRRVTIASTPTPVSLDDARWRDVIADELTIVPPLHKLPRRSHWRFLHDSQQLYILVESELEPDGPHEFAAHPRDERLTGRESLDVILAPRGNDAVSYRFQVGVHRDSRYDAARGLVLDPLDPRFGQDDSAWNGKWQYESKVDPETHLWRALLIIPFSTLSVDKPVPGAVWRANFARHHHTPRDRMDRAIWSSSPGSQTIEDRSLLGEIEFR